MRLECELYTRQCTVCARNKKTNRIARAGLGSYHAGALMERVHLDILVPFVSSLRGNQYVLVLVDQFTKWVECYPLPVQNAETIARAVVDGFISREGCMLQLHTDQGRNFDGAGHSQN